MKEIGIPIGIPFVIKPEFASGHVQATLEQDLSTKFFVDEQNLKSETIKGRYISRVFK